MTAADVKAPDSVAADRAQGHSTTDRVSIAPSPFCVNTADVDRKAFEALRADARVAGLRAVALLNACLWRVFRFAAVLRARPVPDSAADGGFDVHGLPSW